MPGLDGIEVVRRARAANFPGKILMMSGNFSPSHLDAARDLHVDHVLAKPFSLGALLQAVRESLTAKV